jgi:hypothetical protein
LPLVGPEKLTRRLIESLSQRGGNFRSSPIIGPMWALVCDIDGKQDGDPAKAARAVDLVLQAGNTPLRLQVGADSIAAVNRSREPAVTR